MRILIVDDSRFTRALLRRELSDHFDVVEASHGREALPLLDASKPDLVLADLLMPVMNGYEFVKEARRKGFEGPIVVCTANTQPAVQARVREIGATDFVTKPELLVPGKARAFFKQLLAHPALATPADPPPPSSWDKRLEHLGFDALQAMAEALASLTAWRVRLGAPRIGSLCATRFTDAEAALPVRVQITFGEGPVALAPVLLAEEPLAPSGEAGEDVAEEGEGFSRRLVQGFVNRFARITGRETVTSELCVSAFAAVGGAAGRCVHSRLYLSGIEAEGELRFFFDEGAWRAACERRVGAEPPARG
jgi:CheY-like chemotaxis protein